MRRILVIASLLLVACQAISLISPEVTLVVPPEVTASSTRLPASLVPNTPLASPTALPQPGVTVSPLPASTPSPTRPAGYLVRLHPDGPLYAGDQVSVEVYAPENSSLQGHTLELRLSDGSPGLSQPQPAPAPHGQASFFQGGLSGRWQAFVQWVWDTSSLASGEYLITFSIEPGGPSWVEKVVILSADQLPLDEIGARWAMTESDCCVYHYITGTDAERDLAELIQMSEEQTALASSRMGVEVGSPITITLIPKVVGHGGFAADGISVSYLDQNYAGASFPVVLHHEVVHILDQRLGGDFRPSMLVEGLAVYVTGGHFKEGENLLPRAAALLHPGPDGSLGLDRYIPLRQLADSFYPSQHEIGYLEGGALVAYMVDRWGGEAFNAFYRDIHPQNSQADAIDAGLQTHFQIGLEALEQDFLAELRRQTVTQAELDDLRLTIAFYDTVRRYQSELQPSAYFRTAWLPDIRAMRERGIVADYLRQFNTAQTEAVEALLIQSHSLLFAGRYPEAEALLSQANALLDMQTTAAWLWAGIQEAEDLSQR